MPKQTVSYHKAIYALAQMYRAAHAQKDKNVNVPHHLPVGTEPAQPTLIRRNTNTKLKLSNRTHCEQTHNVR